MNEETKPEVKSYGIKETTEAIVFFCRLTNSLEGALEDGKIGFTDITELYGPLQSAPDAFTGIGEMLKELKDLDETEKQTLVDTVAKELDLTFDAVEEIIEDIVESAFDFYMNYKKVRILIKTKKEKK